MLCRGPGIRQYAGSSGVMVFWPQQKFPLDHCLIGCGDVDGQADRKIKRHFCAAAFAFPLRLFEYSCMGAYVKSKFVLIRVIVGELSSYTRTIGQSDSDFFMIHVLPIIV